MENTANNSVKSDTDNEKADNNGLKDSNTLTNAELNGEVVSDTIHGTQTDSNKLYLVAWRRMANSGLYYCYADSEKDAVSKWGYNLAFVKHTVVEINPNSMPVEFGEEK